MQRKQRITKTAMTKAATNWTMSGIVINDGINLAGATHLCSVCGNELEPYTAAVGSCPMCGSNLS